MRHIDTVWPEVERAAHELGCALAYGESPGRLRELDAAFRQLDQAWREAAVAGAPGSPAARPPP